MRKKEKKKEKKEPIRKSMNKLIYWLALLVTIIGNLIISAALIPFLIVFKSQIYLIIIILGIAFGLLFDLLLRDIENIDFKHHVIAGIFIPGIAIVNIFIITNLANKLMEILEVTNVKHNPIIISLVYVVAFMLPYVVSKIRVK